MLFSSQPLFQMHSEDSTTNNPLKEKKISDELLNRKKTRSVIMDLVVLMDFACLWPVLWHFVSICLYIHMISFIVFVNLEILNNKISFPVWIDFYQEKSILGPEESDW